MNGTMTYTRKDFREEMETLWDRDDPWGSAMNIFFDIANELCFMEVEMPCTWGFSPSLLDRDSREPESYFYDICKNTSEEDLLWFGNVLNRYTDILRRNGKDY